MGRTELSTAGPSALFFSEIRRPKPIFDGVTRGTHIELGPLNEPVIHPADA
jgi:hypothetical protein